MIEIRYATDKDINFIATNLRAIDTKELKASYLDGCPYEAVIESAALSDWCKVALVDGFPCVLYGVTPSLEEGAAMPWLVATDDIAKISKRFILANCVRDVAEMGSSYALLFNFVHPENHISINWLKWIGFHVTNTVNENGFIYFYKKGNSLCV